ncbi:permease-like cell division protein FtsX [Caminicella sporogenes]|uniref:permease-like cell division protein FtsX n=1 Tax=Caminicella sporogenes TaxID=166485 RepID=UPI0025407255|nr:permease-like cell division protein FtsX [Caminicella sporogenes]WIF95297.1 permease-like cell division protein FtsX [Caminicella sporogenes]
MKIKTFGYMFKEGFKNIWRNRMMSLVSIGSVSATLIILGIIFVLVLNINNFTEWAKDQFDAIKIYLSDDISEDRIVKIGKEIKQISGIKSVEFESREDALKKMKESWGEHGYLLEGFENRNPLPNSYTVYLENIEDSEKIVNQLKSISGVEKVNFYKDIIDKLIGVTSLIKLIGLAVIAVLIIISVFIIGNTIKLAVAARKREINIMKYVGATNWFIRWPFFIEGTLVGLIGAFLSVLIIYGTYKYIYNLVINNLYDIFTAYILPIDVILNDIIVLFIVLGAGIGALGSLMSMRKYLRV